MPRITQTSTSSDSLWPDFFASGIAASATLSIAKKRKEQLLNTALLSYIDEAPDFHDPYSDLSLFLSQKVRQEMQRNGWGRKWSLKIQEELLELITPEFEKRFPRYRLGVSALRKIWDKVASYLQQLEGQKEAFTSEGKLDLSFFIRENLRQHLILKTPYCPSAHHYTHQLGVKASECLATLDGVRPKLDELTQTIWAVQRHLLSKTEFLSAKSPYDNYDKVDKLIVKAILEITALEPQISQEELEYQVREALSSLKDLPCFSSLDKITGNVSALLAEKLYPSSAFHTSFVSQQKRAILHFIRRQVSLYKGASHTFQLTELLRRIFALYALASQLPKNLSDEQIRSAVLAIYPLPKAEKPDFPQSLYAFISAELILMKNEEYCHSIDYVCQTITEAYREAQQLPELKENSLLEIVTWKILSETEGLLEKLPYVIGQRIEKEIATILIDNPNQSFASVVHATVDFFKRIKELSLCKKWPEVEKRIRIWSLQGDQLCRSIRIDPNTPLLKLIQASSTDSPAQNISEISQSYLKAHPALTAYAPQLAVRVATLYKYSWYTSLSKPEESSLDRFLKWHRAHLLAQSPHLSPEQVQQGLQELCARSLPLTPFPKEQINT